MTTDATGIHTVTDARELADGLATGGFCVLRWELIGEDTDLPEMKLALGELCHERNTLIEFVDLPRKNLTVVFNHWSPPPEADLHDLISGVDEKRWQENHP